MISFIRNNFEYNYFQLFKLFFEKDEATGFNEIRVLRIVKIEKQNANQIKNVGKYQGLANQPAKENG